MVAYPRETAPLATVGADVVSGACVAVDGFGVGFVTAADGSGKTLVQLAEDGSGFHTNEHGTLQRSWNSLGELTLSTPYFKVTDLTALEAQGVAALEETGSRTASTCTSPRGVAGQDADSSHLRRSLLEHLFQGANIPTMAAHAPVSYICSETGAGFLLGSSLAAYVDLSDRYVKLFLSCRRFHYELVVAPGVPAGLASIAAAEANELMARA